MWTSRMRAIVATASLLAAGGAMAQDDQPSDRTSEGKIANTAKDCAALTGKEYDQCIQATPAGPVDLRTGEGSTEKSELAVERKEAQTQESVGEGVPAQSLDSLGHPEQAGTTGEGSSLEEPGAGRGER